MEIISLIVRGSYGLNNHAIHGKGRGRTSHNKPICQLYGISGHTVQKCHHRFDISFTGTNNSQQSHGHISNKPDLSGNTLSSGMTTMVATQLEFVDDMLVSWSRATNHVINQLGNLSISYEYTGNSEIHIGNGTGLLLSYWIASFISSSFPSNSRVLHIQNLLQVPLITKNLSVSQFCIDKNVFLNFRQILVMSRTNS